MNARRWSLLGGSVAAVIALIVLAPHTSYQPGALLAAHQQLASDCSGCHQAWRGPYNQACVNCHGDLSDSNPHSGFDVSQEDAGLMPGHKLVVGPSHNLECLSCHREHEGATVDINKTSAFACTWCHKHPRIEQVTEHVVPVMERKTFVRHLFKLRFDHRKHERLITSDNRPGGFSCISCHLVPAVPPGGHEQMSFNWGGCAGSGCHLSPQDRYLQMPAGLGPSPQSIQYSGVIPVRHIKAVFVHSSGHLQSSCNECHFKMASSTSPDDGASLAIKQCFNCHAHQADGTNQSLATTATHAIRYPAPELPVHNYLTRSIGAGIAFAQTPPAAKMPSGTSAQSRRIVACGECHLFHASGVVPILDFPSRAPEFPPNQPRPWHFAIYLPHLHTAPGDINLGPVPLRPSVFSPWWIGLLALGLVGYRFARHVQTLPDEQTAQEAVAGVAPQRSKDVPALDDTYQTSIRHLYIVGEAAGTASINLAMRSGRQVIEAIVNELGPAPRASRPDLYDVVIVGCGPAGLGATATAKVSGLKYVTLEKLTPASTLRSYPRAKFVQATPIDIEEYGSFFLEGDDSREKLIKEWETIISHMGLVINDREEVVDVGREQDWFVVKTARGNSFSTRCVVLAIGVRGNPRHLNLAGEVEGRVFYTLIEPNEFTGRKILVVGGGNAGAETAQALAAPQLGNQVSYSFRSAVLSNVTPENADAISALQQTRNITLYPSTVLTQIRPGSVVLEPARSAVGGADSKTLTDGPIELENDVIFAMIGAELPAAFLKSIGVKMVSKSRMYG